MQLVKQIAIVAVVLSALIAVGVGLGLFVGHLTPPNEVGRLITVVSGVVFSLALIFATLNFYVNYGFGYQGDIIRRVKTDKKVVALTFDDGPSDKFTPQILDILKEHEVPATFFVVGKHAEDKPQLVERMYEEGHEIANHTYSHINVPTTKPAELSSELINTNVEIVTITGTYPRYARPPRGMYDARYRRLCELMGMTVVLWSLSSQDWRKPMNPQRIQKRIQDKVKPGDILLFHDSGSLVKSEGASRQNTVDALAPIIESLQERGFDIVPLSELLKEYPSSDKSTAEK